MSFSPPDFNLTCNLWRNPSIVTGPPDRVLPCNLAFGRREPSLDVAVYFLTGSGTGAQVLCVPKRSDVSGFFANGATVAQDAVEVPAGSGRFYAVFAVVDIGYGFGNEYRAATILQMNVGVIASTGNPWNAPLWPVPTP
jgi:hypothetical protein